jgi:hypothetical protein
VTIGSVAAGCNCIPSGVGFDGSCPSAIQASCEMEFASVGNCCSRVAASAPALYQQMNVFVKLNISGSDFHRLSEWPEWTLILGSVFNYHGFFLCIFHSLLVGRAQV